MHNFRKKIVENFFKKHLTKMLGYGIIKISGPCGTQATTSGRPNYVNH